VNDMADLVSKCLMLLLYTKRMKIIKDPLINEGSRLSFNYMPIRKSLGMGCFAFFLCVVGVEAAADFKIRYNQKFPCLEVMDSSAVKITDVTEGAKGETVTSGKSSLNISFIKNSSGQPEVTLRDAKSPLSEMEIEAFGLSVGMKPEGTVLVRFGADNKPKFEMDRTGGSRFLMADLGNLDTAAGKEVAANSAPSKNLIRCRERLAEWIGGKGGWSNKSGKILATEGGDSVKVGDLPDREIKVSEAFQSGAVITVGTKKPLLFQSGAGVFHLALPGTVFSLGKLEAGSADLKVELTEGTIQTFTAEALKAPRASLIALGNGEVVRTLDASYQITKTPGQESAITLTSIAGKVILAQEAGGKEVATLSGEKTWSGSKGGEPRALSANSPEKSSLVALQELARNTALIDIARDGVKACPEAVEEIVSTAVKANPDLAQTIAEQCLLANPKLLQGIAHASGVKGLKLSKEQQAKVDALESLDQRLERLAIDGIDLEMKLGQVLLVEGDCKLDGKKEKIMVGQVLALNDKIATGKSGRILVGMAPGVVVSIEPGSVAILEKMSSEIKNGELQSREAVVNSESGLVVMNIAPWNKEKTDVRVKTADGESVAQGTVFAVSYAGGKMLTTVTRGTVGSRDSAGKMVSIAAGQQAAPGATPVATPANSPAVLAAGKAVESTVSAMVANVAASVAAAIPTAAAEVAAIAAKAVPAAAEQIAAAVAAKNPEAAIAIAQAVSKVAPETASKIAAAVIAATPGMDAKSISAITTASSQGATEAPSVDTAAGTEGGGGGGGVGAGNGNIGATTQIQQLQAEQARNDLAAQLKAAQEAEAKAKADLEAANQKEYDRLLKIYEAAVKDREAKQAAAAAAEAARLAAIAEAANKAAANAAAAQAAATAKAAADAAVAAKAAADTDATNKAAADATAAQAAATAKAATEAATLAASQADLAARAAAEAASQADALAKALADAQASAAVFNNQIANAVDKAAAEAAANAASAAANTAATKAKADQEAAAAASVALQKAEAEAAARAQAAVEAAQAAAQLKAALDAATTKAQQDAAAEAARVAAASAKATADAAASAAAAAATSAQTASTSTFNSLTTENKNLANDYKLSNPAALDPATNSVRSARSIFTQAELDANPTLKSFVEKWDAFIEKQREKFAALAEQAAKEAALLVAQQTEAAIKAAADIASAKAAAQAALTAANQKKADDELARQTAENAAKAKALEEARLQGEREAAEYAKAAAAKLAADIAALEASKLADIKAAAAAAAKALADQQAAEAAKVAAAETEMKRLADLETAAANLAAAKAADELAKAQAAATAKALADAAAAAKAIADADAAAKAAAKLAADQAAAAAKAIADAAAAAEAAAKKAAEDAAKNVPPVVTPPTDPNATPTGANG
jgi:trimeric autotransporter adhesin